MFEEKSFFASERVGKKSCFALHPKCLNKSLASLPITPLEMGKIFLGWVNTVKGGGGRVSVIYTDWGVEFMCDGCKIMLSFSVIKAPKCSVSV